MSIDERMPDDELYARVVQRLSDIGPNMRAADQVLAIADGDREASQVSGTMADMLMNALWHVSLLAERTDWRNAVAAIQEAEAGEWIFQPMFHYVFRVLEQGPSE